MNESAEKRYTWTLLGREIGTVTGYDDIDAFIFQLYNFQPAEGIDLSPGTISFDLEKGIAESYDNNGEVLEVKDIISVLTPLTVSHTP